MVFRARCAFVCVRVLFRVNWYIVYMLISVRFYSVSPRISEWHERASPLGPPNSHNHFHLHTLAQIIEKAFFSVLDIYL